MNEHVTTEASTRREMKAIVKLIIIVAAIEVRP